jgi:Glycosyl transferases group 1
VLSAGGCLLTDRLAPESGLGLLFDEGTHYFGYDTPEELVEKARYLLRNPEQALAVARAGNAAFIQSMLPAKRGADLLAWVFEGHLADLYHVPTRTGRSEPAVELMDRLRIYETLQQLHLEKERPRVLFDPAVPEIYRSDAADLRRLQVVVAPHTAVAGPWDAVVSPGPQEIACTVY